MATYVRQKLPNAKIMFWDDMLHNMDEGKLLGFVSYFDLIKLMGRKTI